MSATFEPIIRQAMKTHGYTRQFSTRMKVDDQGCYTRTVDGAPVEGKEKLRIVTEKANQMYGEGNWVLLYAMVTTILIGIWLAAAENPCAVTPDTPCVVRQRNMVGIFWTGSNDPVTFNEKATSFIC